MCNGSEASASLNPHDGAAHEASFSYPNDIGVSPDGRYLYVNDVEDLHSHPAPLAPLVIRRIDLGSSR